MGEMLLNGRLYGASGIRELTQAQYDALPASKLTDGILYCIKDTGIVEGDKYAPVIYSLEEREIGVWTDGKPLYQKVIKYTITSTLSSGVTELFTLDSTFCVQCMDAYVHSNSSTDTLWKIPYVNENSASTALTIQGNKVYARIHSDSWSTAAHLIIVIQYTKTTDIPGSGTWGTDGVPMVHYDGTEKVIGTWFGETLYEKTIDCGAIHTTGSHSTAHGIQNIKRVVRICGNCVSDSNVFFPLPLVQSGDILSYQIRVAANNTNITLSTQSVTDIASTYITIQYTKTN